ncbi:polynucleotide 3'-phosphatase ZDP [Silene latifolia]|uniref:polynucleotide 3'-phosphatase ZDP n=1 Tax=Silene latifolia TaxID=37657 RepID=UPI003D77A2E7
MLTADTITKFPFPLSLPSSLSPRLRNPKLSLTVFFTSRHLPPPKMPPSSSSLIAEYAKSNRSACKTCDKKIEAKTLRLGVVTKDRGYDLTKWHHFHCLSFDSLSVDSAESVTGFDSLKSDDQEALKKIVDERAEVKDTGEQSENVVAEKKQSSSKKKKIKDRDGDVDSVEKEPKKLQLSVSDKAENEIALEVSDIKDIYKSFFSLIAEYAKSNRSACKTCDKKIEAKTLRLGVITKDRGYDLTKWHHFHCLSFDSLSVDSAESITGFDSLKSDDQEALKKIVDERAEVKDTGEQSENVVAEKKQSSNKKKKIKDRDGDVDSVEKEPKKLQLSVSDDAEIEIALEVSDIKDIYKDATLQPKWRAFHSIIFLEKDDGLNDSSKIAAFDFDGCLANTDVKVSGADKWSLMYPSIPDKLQKLYNDGFKLVVFTNESNIDRWTKKRQKAVDSKVGRLNNFIKKVNVPMQVFIACGFDTKGRKDAYRKPQPGMWRVMEKHFNSGIAIDMDQSFYVGDAAGREKDHSDADIKFAQAIGLKFYLPEEFFDVKA